MERTFRLAPRAEAADFAWQAYAAYLQKGGQTEAAHVWRARAREAARTSVFLMPRDYTLLADLLILVILAAIVAAWLYATLLTVRYWGQRRAHLAAQKEQGRRLRAFSLVSLRYWTLGQRVALLTTVLTAWFAVGLFTVIVQGVSRAAGMPLSSGMGRLAGPVTVWHLENRLSPTPERDLLLATAYQQDGANDKARTSLPHPAGFCGELEQPRSALEECRKGAESASGIRESPRTRPGAGRGGPQPGASATGNLGGTAFEVSAGSFHDRPTTSGALGARFSWRLDAANPLAGIGRAVFSFWPRGIVQPVGRCGITRLHRCPEFGAGNRPDSCCRVAVPSPMAGGTNASPGPFRHGGAPPGRLSAVGLLGRARAGGLELPALAGVADAMERNTVHLDVDGFAQPVTFLRSAGDRSCRSCSDDQP